MQQHISLSCWFGRENARQILRCIVALSHRKAIKPCRMNGETPVRIQLLLAWRSIIVSSDGKENTKSSFWNSFVNCVSFFVCFRAEKWNYNFHLRIARAVKFHQQLQQQSVSITAVSILRPKIYLCFPSSNLVQMFWRQFWLGAVRQMPKKVGRNLFVWPKVLSTFPRKKSQNFL